MKITFINSDFLDNRFLFSYSIYLFRKSPDFRKYRNNWIFSFCFIVKNANISISHCCTNDIFCVEIWFLHGVLYIFMEFLHGELCSTNSTVATILHGDFCYIIHAFSYYAVSRSSYERLKKRLPVALCVNTCPNYDYVIIHQKFLFWIFKDCVWSNWK